MKKLTALVLVFCMVFGDYATLFASSEEGEKKELGSAVFVSDLGGMATTELWNKWNGVATAGKSINTVTFVGDTFEDPEKAVTQNRDMRGIEEAVHTALGSGVECLYAYGARDTKSEIEDYTGFLYGEEETEAYYVYAISQSDMKDIAKATAAADKFAQDVASCDVTKPMFIVSHMPLHESKNDNLGAAIWCEVISYVADFMDVVFFWGHNYEEEREADRNAYYVEKNGEETITVKYGEEEYVGYPNFTYMNAGYLNANDSTGRNGLMTMVTIYEESMVFQDYSATAEYEGEYAHNVTVEREFFEEPEVDESVFRYEDWFVTISVAAKANNATIIDVVDEGYDELDQLDTIFLPYQYFAYDIALDGYKGKEPVKITMSIPDENMMNFRLYSLIDGELLEVQGYKVIGDEVVFETTELGIFAFGPADIKVPENAVLSGLRVLRVPDKTEYFVHDSSEGDSVFDIGGLVVEAAYTGEDGNVIYKEIEWDQFGEQDGYVLEYDLSKVGDQYVKVTHSYGGKTFQSGFYITVCQEVIEDEDTGIILEFEDPSTVNCTIKDNTSDKNVQRVLTGLLSNYVSYHFALEGYQAGQEVQVTLPIPEGVENPGVYHIKDDSYIVTPVQDIVDNGDGTVTFTAKRFSSYAVGDDENKITIDASPETAEITGKVTKTIYRYVKQPNTEGGRYILVSGTATDVQQYALKVSTDQGHEVTVQSNPDVTDVVYIELGAKDTGIVWNYGGSNNPTFKSDNGIYMNYVSRIIRLDLEWGDTSGDTYTIGNDSLKASKSYLTYEDGWVFKAYASNKKIYYFEETELELDVGGTYSIAGVPDEITKLALPEIRDSELKLNSILTFTGTNVTPSTVENPEGVVYKVVPNGDPKGVLAEKDGKLVFTGRSGKALVKIEYTGTDVNGQSYTVTNYIHVTAQLPIYEIDITEKETGNSITETVVIKGVTAETTDSLNEVVTYRTNENSESNRLEQKVGDVVWMSSNETIATVDSDGTVRFTGKDGIVQITVAYEYEEGSSVTDTITYSVSQSYFTVPSDGTEDFPEYPNEGAIRFDKHAKEVGNFNQTGIAQVELSMTGVPYTIGNEIDVVIMLDMSTSIDDVNGRKAAAIAAAQKALETLVVNEDGSFNGNRVAIYGFNGWNDSSTNYNNYHKEAIYEYHPSNDTVSGKNNYNISKISGMQSYNASNYNSTIQAIANNYTLEAGTNYAAALRQCQLTLANTKEPNRDQYVIFMTDGFASTGFAYETNNGYSVYDTNSLGTNGVNGLQGTVSIQGKTEYYSKLMKADGVKIFTVGLQVGSGISGITNAQIENGKTVLKKIAGTSEGDATTVANEGYAIFVEVNDKAEEVVNVFEKITQSIMEAATNVVLEDKIADAYTMIFELPSGVTKEAANGMDEFYIDVLEYSLDPTTKERTTHETLERIYIGFDSTSKTYYPYYYNGTTKTNYSAYDETTNTGVTVVTATDDNGKAYVQSIATAYFTYNADTRILVWSIDKLDIKELALSYFLYLDRSAGHEVSEQVDAGPYDTNDYAHLSYTNFRGEDCRQYFPIPQMMWNGAQVSYAFYLVDENGNPVNRAGQIVPFSEAVYVTDTYSYKIIWSGLDQSSELEAAIVAEEYLPSVYQLYDPEASYTIHVYEDEEGRNLNNHFKISGSANIEKDTTYVFNTKADATKYSAQGIYSLTVPFLCKDYAVTGTEGNYQYAGSGTQYEDKNGNKIYITDKEGTYTVIYNYGSSKVQEDFDFKDTMVVFGVLWKPELVEDVVVIDYGLPVVIDVAANDSISGKLVGVRKYAPENVEINKGSYQAAEETSVDLEYGIAQIEDNSLTAVRYTLNKMSMDEPEIFYYESEVSYYVTQDAKKVLKTEHMYSSVTVIPATTIYYEDNQNWIEYSDGWTTDGTPMYDIQATDRPGEDKIGNGYDADNVYGYDSVYDNQTIFSMGSAQRVTVSADSGVLSTSKEYETANACPSAEFTFKGTGFDLISRTDSTSGLIMVTVTSQATGDIVERFLVNNYYGMTLTYNENDGKWIATKATQGDAIYQVPVVQVTDLAYGAYTVKVEVAYAPSADYTGTNSYSFWLDGVRVYEPADPKGDYYEQTVLAAYREDNEANPGWVELRDILLGAGKLSADDENVNGVIFIDGDAEVTDNELGISEYNDFGPNNEVYLTQRQSIAFKLVATAQPNGLQIGAKLGKGSTADLLYQTIENDKLKTLQTISLNSATDRNYVIENITWTQTGALWESNTIVFTNNTSAAIISLTNLKAIGAEFSDLETVSEVVTEQEEQVVERTAFRMTRTALPTVEPEEEVVQVEEVQAVEETSIEEVQIVEEKTIEAVPTVEKKSIEKVKIAVVSSYAMIYGIRDIISVNPGNSTESGEIVVPENSVSGVTDTENKNENNLISFLENIIKNPISNKMEHVASSFRRSQETFVLISGVMAVSMLMMVAIKPELLQLAFRRR